MATELRNPARPVPTAPPPPASRAMPTPMASTAVRKTVTFGLPHKQAGHRVIVYGPGGIGKCLGKGTPVLMFNGTIKAVEEIKENDVLMGPDSLPRYVSGLHHGVGPLFKVTPKRGDYFVCNGHHPLPVRLSIGGGQFRDFLITAEDFLTAKKSIQRDAVMWRAPVSTAWGPSSLPIDPYLFGCWLADGTSGHPEITTMDSEVYDAMVQYANANGMVVNVRAQTGKAYTYSIVHADRGHSNPFIDSLRNLNVDCDKSIPLMYKTASWEQRMELLAGVLDGDGCLANNGVSFDLILKSKTLSDDIVFVARSLGFGVSQVKCEKTCTNGVNGPVTGEYWRVIIGGDTATIPNRIARRKASKRDTNQNALHVGFKVEPFGEGDFYGFEVDYDHLFMLGDFTVTHNTTLAAHAPAPVAFIDLDDSLPILWPQIEANGLQEAVRPVQGIDTWPQLIDVLNGDGWDGIKTLVIDTGTKAEELCVAEVIAKVPHEKGGKVDNIEGYGFGKGLSHVFDMFLPLLSALDRHAKAGRHVVIICHECSATFPNPMGQDFLRYEPRLQSPNSGKASIRLRVREWADHLLFLAYDVAEKDGKGIGCGSRTLYPREMPYCMAKSRTLADPMPYGDNAADIWAQVLGIK